MSRSVFLAGKMNSTERRRRQRRRRQRDRQRLGRAVFVCALGVIFIAAAIFLWNGVIHGEGPEPEAVKGLEAKACYADLTLTWDQANKADGYFIYAADGEAAGNEAAGEAAGEAAVETAAGDETVPEGFAQIGEVTGGDTCKYVVDEYTRDKEYQFMVKAYGYNSLTKNKNEGEPSEVVSVKYDSSKYAQKIPVLTYHKVIPAGESFESSLNINADVLDQEMAYLHDNGFKTLTMDEFYKWHAGKLEVPVKSCVVTFDDGFYGTYYLAYPILKKYEQAGTVFCIGKNTAGVTDPFTPETDGEQNHYVRQDVIEKVREEYPRFEFESHTYDMHNRVDGKKPAVSFSYEQIMEDCAKNEQFGVRYLAYPWGTYSDTMQQAVHDSGYKLAYAYDPFYYAKRTDPQYAVNRIKIPGKMPMEDFIRIVNGEATEYDAE